MTRLARVIPYAFLAAVLCSSGCQTLSHHQRCAAQPTTDTVTTGGAFAKSKSIAIPELGLTLSDAVTQVLRPGLTRSLSGPVLTQAVVPLGQQVVASKSSQDIVAILVKAATENSLSDPVIQSVVSRVATDDIQLRQAVRDLISSAESLAILQAPREGDNLSEAQLALAAEIDEQLGTAVAPLAAEASPPQTKVVQSPYWEAAVVLTRRNGPRMVIPLWMVESYAAGDILLEDQDYLEIKPFAQTDVGRRSELRSERKQGKVLLTGLATAVVETKEIPDLSTISSRISNANFENVVDVFVLQTQGSDGRGVETWFPNSANAVYGELPTTRWTTGRNLNAGDIVQLNATELMPVIRYSRERLRESSLPSKSDVNGTWVGKLAERKSELDEDILNFASNIPGVGQVASSLAEHFPAGSTHKF